MKPFDDYDLRIASKDERTAKWSNIWRLGVVVFTRPEDRVCKEVIGPSLRYLHELTGEKVHFYFVGFFDRKDPVYERSVETDFFDDDQQWYFSAKKFVDVQTKFQNLTNLKWCYSGGTDLLIVPYRIREGVFYIDNSGALDIKMSRLIHEKHHYMPEELIQILNRELQKGKDIDGVSNSQIMEGIGVGLKAAFTSWLPKGLAEAFRMLEPFAVTKFG